MPTAKTLDVELLLRQVREAGRLYEHAKACPTASAAAERRASELTLSASRTIQAAIECEAQVEQQDAAKHPRADEVSELSPSTGGWSNPDALQRGSISENRAAASAKTDDVSTTTSRPAEFTSTVSSVPLAPSPKSIDYSRFDAVAAELASDSDEEKENWTDQEKKMTTRELRQITHRIAGVIDEVKATPFQPEASKQPALVAPRVPSASATSSPPLRDAVKVRAMYSADYSRFASVTCALEGDDAASGNSEGSEPCEDGLFSKRTIRALGECEARLEALANASDFDDAEQRDCGQHSTPSLDDMD